MLNQMLSIFKLKIRLLVNVAVLKAVVVICFVLVLPIGIFASQRIFMLDCSKSMTGYDNNENIWGNTKSFLQKQLLQMSEKDDYLIIPFQGKTTEYKEFFGNGGKFSKNDWNVIEHYCDSIVNNLTPTDICGVWEYVISKINLKIKTSLIILTDGKDNVRGQKELYRLLREFCGKFPQAHCFYAMLTPTAKDEAITQICDECPEMHALELDGRISDFDALNKNYLRIDVRDANKECRELYLVNGGSYRAKAICDDNNIGVNIKNDTIIQGRIILQFQNKNKINSKMLREKGINDYTIKFRIETDEAILLNDTITLQVSNRKPYELFLDKNEKEIGEESYYPTFWFCKEKKIEPLSFELNPKWGRYVIPGHSCALLRVEATDQESLAHNHFSVMVNGGVVPENTIRIVSGVNYLRTSILFHSDAKDGMHSFYIKVLDVDSIDTINGEPPVLYKKILKANFKQRLNPLLILLIILGILLLALLIYLWIKKGGLYSNGRVGQKGSTRFMDNYSGKKEKNKRRKQKEKKRKVIKKKMNLIELLMYMDYEVSEEEKDAIYNALPHNVQNAIEYLWKNYYRSPKSALGEINGKWSGDAKDSVWIPNDNYTPKNSSYSNLNDLNWAEIKRKHGFYGLRFDRGHAVFSEVAKYKVKLSSVKKFDQLVSSDGKEKDRESLHEEAFRLLSKKTWRSVSDIKKEKEDPNDVLVWHEEIDCRTLYLVPQEIHGNISHFGGIGVLRAHRINGLELMAPIKFEYEKPYEMNKKSL